MLIFSIPWVKINLRTFLKAKASTGYRSKDVLFQKRLSSRFVLSFKFSLEKIQAYNKNYFRIG
jgi:hypothetical protein